ncbi:MAG: RbsD/FucU domain-containing protein [Devosia sp.]
MLRGIPPILGPDMLHIMRAMGHGDELVIADANFPASSQGPEVIRIDGVSGTDLAEAILKLMPLDEFVPEQAFVMQVVGDPSAKPPVVLEYEKIVAKYEPKAKVGSIERMEFYERAKTTFAIVQTGENRLYGNLILKKGIIRPD